MQCLETLSFVIVLLTLLEGTANARKHRHAHLHPDSNIKLTNNIVTRENGTNTLAKQPPTPTITHQSMHISQQRLSSLTLIEGYQGEEKLNSERNYTRHLAGRHVCSQERNIPKVVKSSESYCKPTYRHYTTRCRDNSTLLCEAVRLVYETAYRDVYKTKLTKETSFACCPGWAQESKYSNGCLKAICKKRCLNGGSCIQPDTCACLPGYYGSTCEHDLNECSENKPCDQLCFNIPGSFYCTCREGFTLQSDKQSCKKNGANEVSLEARDMEYEHLNDRILKIEKILENDKNTQSIAPYNVNTKIEDAIKSIHTLKKRLDIMEQKQNEFDYVKNSLFRYKIHSKKHKVENNHEMS